MDRPDLRDLLVLLGQLVHKDRKELLARRACKDHRGLLGRLDLPGQLDRKGLKD